MSEFHPYQVLSPKLLSTMVRIKGSEEGFSYFYDHFKKKLDVTVRYTLNTPSCTDPCTHGEDIKQVVLLAVKRELDRLQAGTREEIEDPVAYFSRTALNCCSAHLKVCRQQSGIALEDVSEAELHKGIDRNGRTSILDVPTDPEKILERKELLNRVNECIGKLKAESELIIRLRVQHELSYEEIGDLLDITPIYARKRYSLAQRELRILVNIGGTK